MCPPMANPTQILDAESMKRAISRIAQQVLELNGGAGNLVVVGLHTNGVFIARRIAAAVRLLEGADVPVGTMDITLYRDDVGMREAGPHLPTREGTNIPFDITDKIVLLVDDVLHTGRSIRAALDQLMDLGRPRKIQLAGLVDRGARELPIRADFVGREISIRDDENVKVRMSDIDGTDEVIIVDKESTC